MELHFISPILKVKGAEGGEPLALGNFSKSATVIIALSACFS